MSDPIVNMPLDITTTVISHNHRDMLSDCLRAASESLELWRGSGRIVVLDNASTDGSADLVRDEFPSVELFRQHSPRGFAANQNELFRSILPGTDAVLLLNDDAFVSPDTVTRLAEVLSADGSIGAIAPRLVYPDGRFQTAGERLPSWGYHVGRHLGLGRLVPARIRPGAHHAPPQKGQARLSEVGYVAMACVLIRRDCLAQVGLLDEQFQMYSEDADWFLRARQAGWRTCVLQEAVVVHQRGQSWGRFSARERERSMYRYLRKHGASRPAIGVLKAVVVTSYSARLLAAYVAVRLRLRSKASARTDLLIYRDIIRLSLSE